MSVRAEILSVRVPEVMMVDRNWRSEDLAIWEAE